MDRSKPTKALFYGIAAAALAGLLCGAILQYGARPGDEAPEGPQLRVSGPSARDPTPAGWAQGGVALTGYRGEVPDYVIGTDWLHPATYEVAEAYLPADAPAASHPIREATYDTPVAYAPPPQHTPAAYPSVDGDILAGLSDPLPPPPPLVVAGREPMDALDQVNARIAADGRTAAIRIAHRPS